MSHPWSTGATSFLSTYGLGLHPTDAGWANWQAVPLLLDNTTTGLSWVKGTVPSPHGPFSADFDLRNGLFEVNAPDGVITGRLGIPKLRMGVATVRALLLPSTRAKSRVAGAVGAPGRSASGGPLWIYTNTSRHSNVVSDTAKHIAVEEDSQWMYITGLQPGTHRFQVEYHTIDSFAAPPSGKWDPNNTDFKYEATFNGVDNRTNGEWVGQYGSGGFVLFNYSADSTDIVKLDPRIRR